MPAERFAVRKIVPRQPKLISPVFQFQHRTRCRPGLLLMASEDLSERNQTMTNIKVLIIGGGIAGLCSGVYLRKNGFFTEILEMHSLSGGLATAWKRNGYTFENCVHWLVG
jgi:hypothetical protein